MVERFYSLRHIDRQFTKLGFSIFQIRIQHHIIEYKILYQMHILIFDSEFFWRIFWKLFKKHSGP